MERKEREQFCQKLKTLLEDKDPAIVDLATLQETLEASENPSYRALGLSMNIIKKGDMTNRDTLEHVQRIVCSTLF